MSPSSLASWELQSTVCMPLGPVLGLGLQVPEGSVAARGWRRLGAARPQLQLSKRRCLHKHLPEDEVRVSVLMTKARVQVFCACLVFPFIGWVTEAGFPHAPSGTSSMKRALGLR